VVEISARHYEQAIIAKDHVIRELTKENIRLRARITRLLQMQIEGMEKLDEEVHRVSRN
jgi:hypothetical protein